MMPIVVEAQGGIASVEVEATADRGLCRE